MGAELGLCSGQALTALGSGLQGRATATPIFAVTPNPPHQEEPSTAPSSQRQSAIPPCTDPEGTFCPPFPFFPLPLSPSRLTSKTLLSMLSGWPCACCSWAHAYGIYQQHYWSQQPKKASLLMMSICLLSVLIWYRQMDQRTSKNKQTKGNVRTAVFTLSLHI